MVIESEDAGHTERIAAALAACVQPPLIILLEGDLGAGKTTFVRGFVHALNEAIVVQSPTFALARRYPTTPPVHHIDLYRLEAGGLDELGITDLLSDDDAISLVEWPREHAFAGLKTARVRLLELGPERRRIELSLPNDVDTARFESLARAIGSNG